MPVDHDERRRRIAEVTAAVIAHEGLDAATIRRIAAELGGPTKIITYYFAEKQELLHFTWQHIAQQYSDQVAALAPTDIIGRLMAMAVADEAGVTRWRVYAAFWDRAARDPVFADLQRRHIALALEQIAEMARALGVAPDQVERVSLLLNATVQGIAVQALADRELWSADRIRAALTDQVEMLLGRRLA
jgi:AcrR family transcriptional regulator